MNDSWNAVWPVPMFPWQMSDPLGAWLSDFISPAPVPATRGAFSTRRYTDACGTRDYKLYIPSAYAGQPLPLLLMLHGCGQGADEFASATRMNALAEQRQCFVVYPEQSPAANCARCWNWFNRQDQQRGQGEPAIIAGITRAVMAEFGIDAGRVFVAGLSAGGAMAVIMGRTYPDLFKAVGCHSGLPYGAATDAVSALDVMRCGTTASAPAAAASNRAMPVIVFHGDGDSTVHPSHGGGVIRQSLAAPPSRQTVVRGVGAGRAYTRTTHTVHDDAGAAMLSEEWIVHGAGHAWSGADGGPDAGSEMLRFFMA